MYDTLLLVFVQEGVLTHPRGWMLHQVGGRGPVLGPPYNRRCSRTAFFGGHCSPHKRDCRPPRLLVSQGGAAWAGTEATRTRVGRSEKNGPICFKREGTPRTDVADDDRTLIIFEPSRAEIACIKECAV